MDNILNSEATMKTLKIEPQSEADIVPELWTFDIIKKLKKRNLHQKTKRNFLSVAKFTN